MMGSSVDDGQYASPSKSESLDDGGCAASEHDHDSDNDSASDSSVHSHIGSSVTLLSAFEDDAFMRKVAPSVLVGLRRDVKSLQRRIHSEMVAHTLTLYHYVRLQQKLMQARRCGRLAAARQLNRWLDVAYSDQSDMLKRLKRDAPRLFDLFSEPADDDEWWVNVLEQISATSSRAKHLLESLFILNHHHAAIKDAYTEENQLMIIKYYILNNKWSARKIEKDLEEDGVVASPLQLPPHDAAAESGEAEEEGKKEINDGSEGKYDNGTCRQYLHGSRSNNAVDRFHSWDACFFFLSFLFVCRF